VLSDIETFLYPGTGRLRPRLWRHQRQRIRPPGEFDGHVALIFGGKRRYCLGDSPAKEALHQHDIVAARGPAFRAAPGPRAEPRTTGNQRSEHRQQGYANEHLHQRKPGLRAVPSHQRWP